MPVAFGFPGFPEMMVILVIVIMLFGVGKLPKVLSQMGKGVKAFKDGMNTGDDDDDFSRPRELNVNPHEARGTASRSAVSEAEEIR